MSETSGVGVATGAPMAALGAPPPRVAAIQAVFAELDREAGGIPGGIPGGGAPPSFAAALVAAAQAAVDAAGSAGLGGSGSSPPAASLAGGLSSLTAASPGSPLGALAPSSAGSVGGETGGPTGGDVVATALQDLGVPYRWGGTSRETGFDCSGLVQHVFAKLGVALPRTTYQQVDVGTPVASLAAAQPGDLVFFGTPPHHVGIYLGDGRMIDAPYTGVDVRIDPVGQPSAIRQVVPPGGPTVLAGSGGVGASLLGATLFDPSLAGLAAVPSAGTETSLGWPAADLSGWGSGQVGEVPAPPGSPAVPAALAGDFAAATARYGLPAGLLPAVASVESNFDPTAVSPAGALGLMQLMPATAASLGVDPYVPAQAIDGAARLLAAELARFGSLPLAIAAYNAGSAAVARYGGIPPYPQTENYVRKVLSRMPMETV